MARLRFGAFLAPNLPIGESFDREGEAVLARIMENERAAKAMEEGLAGQTSMPAHHGPTSDQPGRKP